MEYVQVQTKRPLVIRTPDHRLRIFVSSTLKELAEERKAVYQAISRLHLAPVMFESGARPHPAQELYQAYLSQSHIFIGIYWQNYGWIGPGMQISGLEDEYNRSAGMPRLIYVKSPAAEQHPALTRMLERIRDENATSYKYFKTLQELRTLVENDLVLLMTEYFESAIAREFPEEKKTASTLTNLPIPRNPLIGREKEMEIACRLLQQEDVALVTLTGPAGIGKSRLGIQIALELRDQFSDGVYMVMLETITDPGLVIPTIAKTLSITEPGGELTFLEALKAYLCHKQVLLLLDNFEHVLPAASQLADLLEGCLGVKMVVTSRASLRLRAEKILPIPPLTIPPIEEFHQSLSLSQYSAIQLFIQRCQAVKADFQVTNENAPAVAEICYRLDGLPLAIELAAARIKLLPPQSLLAHLEHRFQILRGGTKELPDRQRTMYRAIDWSYSLLEENERQLFLRLSVFCGSWTIQAALEVSAKANQGYPEILDGLQVLLDNNLIKSIEDGSDETRMRMLESIREFAYQHLLESSEAEQLHERFIQYYLQQASQAETDLRSLSQLSRYKWVDAELCNLRTVLKQAIEQHRCVIALQITTAIWRFWWKSGYWSEGLQWLTSCLAGQEEIPMALKAKALTQSSWFYRSLGNFPQSITLLKEALALWQQTGDQNGCAMALKNMGASLLRQGDIKGALKFLDQALKLYQQQDDKFGIYTALEILGDVAAKQGNRNKAIELYSQALVLAEQVNDDDYVMKLSNNLGDEFVIMGNYDLAEEYFRRATELSNQHGNRIISAYVAGNRSIIAIKKRNYPLALDLLVEAITVLHEIGDKADAILCLEPFAYIARDQGEPARAVRLFGASETLQRSIGMTREQPMQKDYELNIADLRIKLETAEFSTAWDEGSRMTLDQAVAYAILRSD